MGKKRSTPSGKRAKSPMGKRLASSAEGLRKDMMMFADAKLVVEGRDIAVHRGVICQASIMFKNTFAGPFKEAEQCAMVINDSTAEAVGIVVDFAYCNDGVYSAMSGNFDPRSPVPD